MIIDSSALIAIFLQEPGYKLLLSKLSQAEILGIGAPTVVACSIVLSARMKMNSRVLIESFLSEAEIEVLPFTSEHWPLALEAYLQFGKGNHAAALNLGDCLSYAVSQVAHQPLLFKGSGFLKTDVEAA